MYIGDKCCHNMNIVLNMLRRLSNLNINYYTFEIIARIMLNKCNYRIIVCNKDINYEIKGKILSNEGIILIR